MLIELSWFNKVGLWWLQLSSDGITNQQISLGTTPATFLPTKLFCIYLLVAFLSCIITSIHDSTIMWVLHFILPISTIQLLLSLHRLGRFSPSPVNHTHIYFCCFNRHFCWVNLHQTLFFLVESPWVLTSHDRFFAIIFRLIMNIISLDWRYRNYLDLMSQLCGSDILAYDYCGYGFSTGRPSEENCYESIEARGGPGGGKDGGIIELDIWPVTWGYTQIYIYI